MSSQSHSHIPPQFLKRLVTQLEGGRRIVLGLVGPPGCGKSTLASVIHGEFPGISQIVPMDGFHLANSELQRLGRSDRKGAPDTFDAAGYVTVLGRLRHQGPDETVYVPEFRREIEEPIAGCIPVVPQTQLVITEGNYLLLDRGDWRAVASLLDDSWYIDVADQVRTQRLISRHEKFGRSAQAARDWVANTDEPNAQLIASTRSRAKLVFSLTT
jgi:pantothenate kinase